MRNPFIMIIFVSLIASASAAVAALLLETVTFSVKTGEKVRVEWEPGELCEAELADPCFWRWELVDLPEGRKVLGGEAQLPFVEFQMSRSGLHAFRVQACAGELCSGWSVSLVAKNSKVEGADQGWSVYGSPAGPGDIQFE